MVYYHCQNNNVTLQTEITLILTQKIKKTLNMGQETQTQTYSIQTAKGWCFAGTTLRLVFFESGPTLILTCVNFKFHGRVDYTPIGTHFANANI